MVIVTGGSGQLGHAIVEHLLRRLPPSELGVSVRDPSKAQDLLERGVRVRRGDFNDPTTLRSSFEGCSQVLLVSSNGRSVGADPVEQHRTAIRVAREAGARRILYTSHQAASPTSAFGPARDHAETEGMLGAAKVPFTSLRNGFYATTVRFLLSKAMETGELKLPADGKVSWTAPSDLAEAAAVILAEEGRFDGTITLTASEMLDFDEVAAIAAELTDRAIKRVTVSDADFVAGAVARGVPEGAAKIMLSIFTASRAAEFAVLDPTLPQILGRTPSTVRDLLGAAFRRADAGSRDPSRGSTN